MKKFYIQKEATQEETPILLRLERRHTLMAGEKDSCKEDPGNERRASRANSVGSVSSGGGTTANVVTPVGQTRAPSTDKCMSDDKMSIFSRSSTVVITESELSSSWLYNSQKAQIESSNETTLESQTGTATGSLDNLIPEALQVDRLSKPSALVRPKRKNSCCCYMTIALFIFLASLGILTAIGGVIYMELFASYVATSNHSTAAQTRDRLWIESGVERTLGETLQTDQTAPGMRLPGKFEPNVTLTNGTLLSEGESNSSVNIPNENQFHPVSNENNSIDLIKNGDHGDRSAEAESSKNDGDSKEATRELSNQDKLDLFMKFNEEVNKHFFVNESQISRKSPDDPDSSSESDIDAFVDRELDSHENNSDVDDVSDWSDIKANDPLGIHNLSVIPGQLAYLPFDRVTDNDNNNEDMHGTEISHPKENLHLSLDSKNDDSFPQSNINKVGMKTSDDSVTKDSDQNRINDAVDDSVNKHLTENPSADQKGVPFEFFRRLGFNEASFSAHPALTVEDMNVKFSLAEALKYLRSLDASNRLPTSRQKSEIRRNGFTKMAIAGEERENYLNKLRENLFS